MIAAIGAVGLVILVGLIVRDSIHALEHDGWEEAYRLAAERTANYWVIQVHDGHVEDDPMRERRGIVPRGTPTVR